MGTIATVSFLLWSLAALILAIIGALLSMAVAAGLEKAWPLAFTILFKIIAALASVAFSLSALLNIAVFLIQVAKAN